MIRLAPLYAVLVLSLAIALVAPQQGGGAHRATEVVGNEIFGSPLQ